MQPLPHHILTHVAPYIPDELIPTDRLARIDATHANLPDRSTVAAGFELRLAGHDSQVDSFVAVSTAPESRDVFAEFAAKSEACNRANSNPGETDASDPADSQTDAQTPQSHAWNRVREFCREWRNPASPIRDVTHLWLEFDHAANGADLKHSGRTAAAEERETTSLVMPPVAPGPSLIYAPPVEMAPGSIASQKLTKRTLNILLGPSEKTDAIAQNYLRCESALPPGARIKHAGVMLPRKIRAVRIVIENLAARDLPDYLERIGWPGDFARLGTFLHEYKQFLTQTLVDLDLSKALYPNLGIEISFPQAEIERWPAFLQFLIDRGLCSPEKGAGLAGWIGPHGLDIPETRPGILWRTLNHIKLTLRPESAATETLEDSIDAKAYLGYIAGRRPAQLLKVEYDHPSRLRDAGAAGGGRLYDYLPGPPTIRPTSAAVHDVARSPGH